MKVQIKIDQRIDQIELLEQAERIAEEEAQKKKLEEEEIARALKKAEDKRAENERVTAE